MVSTQVEYRPYYETALTQPEHSYHLQILNPLLQDNTICFDRLHQDQRLHTSDRSIIDRLISPSGTVLASKIFLNYPAYENEEMVNTPDEEYAFLDEMEGHDSFVYPYGRGVAINKISNETFDAMFMEYIPGISLKVALNNAMNTAKSIFWFDTISAYLCAAVDHQRVRNIVHRDLSGDNIRIVNNRIKILDFGIAKKLTTEKDVLQLTTKPIGTPHIAPPEEFDGIISCATDSYAIGVHHLAWLMGTTDEVKLLDVISALHGGSNEITYNKTLTQLLEQKTLASLSNSIQHLLAKDFVKRQCNLFEFREQFTWALSQDRKLPQFQ